MGNLAIIPARSGSKGIKDKNIRNLNGKPLMAYSIEAALSSGCFDTVMVSTDSKAYAEIAEKYGAEVPFLRSLKTSSDSASSWEAVEEVLADYRDKGKEFESFCLLQPTSPLRNADDIRKAYKLYETKASFAVVSVCEAEHSPLLFGKLPQNMEFIDFIGPESMKRRQEVGTYYRLNGAIYILNISKFKSDSFFYTKGSFAYLMSREKSVDIDTELDLKMAGFLLKEII